MGNLRDLILAAEDLPKEAVQTDEWAPFGVPSVLVRGFTAKERDDWEMSLTVAGPNGTRIQNPRLKNLRSSFVVRVIVDENGERVFEDKDVEALSNKNAAVIDRIWDKAREMSGMITEEEENPSTGDQEEPSSSDSPSPSEYQTRTT